jgi:hypothetical protein
MTEIKLGRIPHSLPRRSKAKTGALPIPHLNGSFPEFILGFPNLLAKDRCQISIKKSNFFVDNLAAFC